MTATGFMNRYSKAFGQSTTMENDWRWLFALCLGCVLFNLGLRLSLWTIWDNPMLRVGDEFIMSTHDTYLWLAHSRVAEMHDGRSLAYFTRFLHEHMGIGLGAIGFWAPAFLGSLAAVPCVLWGWFLGGRSAAVFAGIVGTLTPGFYARSRLGYYDTDLFTLLMPLLMAFFLACWLRQRTSFLWLSQKHDIEPSKWLPLQVLAMGLFARFAGWWHWDIANYTALLALVACSIGIIFARPQKRADIFFEMAIFIFSGIPMVAFSYRLIPLYNAAGHTPYIILMLTFAALLAAWRTIGVNRRSRTNRRKALITALCTFTVALFLTGVLTGPLGDVLEKLLLYLKPASTDVVTSGAAASGPIYPRVTQSIIEAISIPLDVVFERISYHFWVGVVALCAIIPLLPARPLAVLLVPMVVLGLLSAKMGVRFSMFGGAPLMITLGVVAAALFRTLLPETLRFRRSILTASTTVLGLCLVLPTYADYRSALPTPVLDKAHAEALIGLGERAPEDAVIWTWWDWGYATQYYAGLRTPIDGGRHAGKDLFPTAAVMATNSPKRANQLIRYSADFPLMDPTREWNTMTGEEVQAFINRLGKETIALNPVPKQYLAVSYKDLRIAKWLMFYGMWNSEAGASQKPTIRRFGPGQMAVNLQIGGVMNRNRQRSAIATADMLDAGAAEHFSYPQNKYSPHLVPKTPHLVFNKLAGESTFFDKETYESMLVTLFTGDPESERIKPYFRLVADGLPFIRIYEVLQK